MLSSCTTDEGDEEMAVFKNDTDPNKWHNKQHLWMLHQEKNKSSSLNYTDDFKSETALKGTFLQTKKPLDLERSDSKELQTAYSEVETLENLKYDHTNTVLQDY